MPEQILLATTEPAVTQEIARRLAAHLRGGDLLVLDGPLGAGKTTFTQGLGEGLGVRGPIASPTFVISRVHPSLVGGPELVHVDAYRLGGATDLDDLDLDSDLDQAVTVVEWGRDLAEHLVDSWMLVELRRPDVVLEDRPEEPRTLALHPIGPRWDEAAVAALAADLTAVGGATAVEGATAVDGAPEVEGATAVGGAATPAGGES